MKLHLFIGFLGFGWAACASVGPNYRATEPLAPAAWVGPAPSALPVTGGSGDLSLWWRNFNDPFLNDLVERALANSPDFRIAALRLRQARARYSGAAASRYPDVFASASARRDQSIGTTGKGADGNQYSAGLDASWELDVFGGVRRGVEAAEADVAFSEESLRDARVTLTGEVAIRYVDVRALQIRLAIARSNLASQTETAQLARWRAQAGLVSAQDVDQADSNLEQTRAQIPSLEISLAESEHSLEFLLGEPPGTLHARLSGSSEFPNPSTEVALGIPADTLRQRPDVRAAERALAAETARVGVAQAALYPSFKLSGTLGLEALTLGALGDGAASSLLAGITAPIFNAGRLRSQVDVQEAVRESSRVTYEQTVLRALQEVENALVALARNHERGEALMRAAQAARNAMVLARQRYGAGLIDFQSVLDTGRSVLSLEDSLASSRAENVLALIRLYKALGGGWQGRIP